MFELDQTLRNRELPVTYYQNLITIWTCNNAILFMKKKIITQNNISLLFIFYPSRRNTKQPPTYYQSLNCSFHFIERRNRSKSMARYLPKLVLKYLLKSNCFVSQLDTVRLDPEMFCC